ncbi:sensor histidine kinase [Polaribacter sp. Hel1_85]|uniref:sensor histidine kinase n=1 Tax=Polaribacter sp. Hel1_85 TaxID=1250005 RepID=UPI00052D14E7|nr:histidine kinase [Polaribacter sp. Hel1_85]KGL63461.1 two-component system sensor histidine kinase [Polaribacter sp. Hel1_85]
MSKLDSWIDNKIVQNLFIWFFFFLILLSTVQSENRVLTSLFIILLLVPAVYVNNLFVLPFLRKKTILFFLFFLVNILCFTAVSVLLITVVSKQDFELRMLINFFGIMILAMVFSSAIKLARDSFTRRQQEKEAELKLLKAQLNPHFLFNTLNNLYGLSVIKSDKLPNLMLKLSDLLRYSLYETKETLVPLEKEITYLENYMSLEKIRLEDKTNIQYTKSGNLSSKKIAPMLLIVFVENAFKHLGVLETKKSSVSVSIKEEGNSIIFKCENTIDKFDLNEENLEKSKSGIGLKNAKKRLALIYSDKHKLTTNKNNRIFSVVLKLNL